jgi:hypothetical protein
VANSAAIYANGAFIQANAAFIAANTPSNVANSAASYANSAFLAANTPSATANSAATYANGAFIQANAAYNQANTDFTNISITTGTYGNSSYIPIITVSANGRINSISTIASSGGGGGSGTDQTARDTANAAFIQANAAFAQANTGGGGGSGAAAGPIIVNTFTGTGACTIYTLSSSTTSNNTIINVDGVLQLKSAYSISGTTLTLTSAPANNALIEVLTFVGSTVTGYNNRTYTGDNTTVSFAITSGASNNSLIVTENGIVQEPGVDYYISGNNVIFTTAPSTGVKVGVRELSSIANASLQISNSNTIISNSVSSINFTGNGVSSITTSNNSVTVNISGGGGGLSKTTAIILSRIFN